MGAENVYGKPFECRRLHEEYLCAGVAFKGSTEGVCCYHVSYLTITDLQDKPFDMCRIPLGCIDYMHDLTFL